MKTKNRRITTFLALLVFILVIFTSCSSNKANIKVYSVSTGGNSTTLNIDAEEEPDIPSKEYEDQAAAKEVHSILFGMELNGLYSHTFEGWKGIRDHYKVPTENSEEVVEFEIDRNTGKICFFAHFYYRNYVWPEEKIVNKMTEQECLPIAEHYLKEFTEMAAFYSLEKDNVIDGKNKYPNRYSFAYVLRRNGIQCDYISIDIRSDGELISIDQDNVLNKQYYELAGNLDSDKLFKLSEETLKNKLEGKYNDYSIEYINAYFAYYYDKMNFARVCYDIYTDKTDLYPARFVVVVPLQLCKK